MVKSGFEKRQFCLDFLKDYMKLFKVKIIALPQEFYKLYKYKDREQ